MAEVIPAISYLRGKKKVFQGDLGIFDLSENGKYEDEQLWKMLIDFYSCVFVEDSFLLKTCSHLGLRKGH